MRHCLAVMFRFECSNEGLVVNRRSIRYERRMIKPRRTLKILLATIVIGFSTLSAHAQSGPVDLTRLHWTSGEHWLMSVPVEMTGTFTHVGAISFRSWDQEGMTQRPHDDLGLLRLNLSPKLVATGNTWPVFQHYIAEVELEAREYISDSGADLQGVDSVDPGRISRSGWSDARLLQAYVQAVGEHWALKAGLSRSHWGAGMLSNSHRASKANVFSSPFGASPYVDRFFRAQLVSFPWGSKKHGTKRYTPLTVALAGDATLDDGSSDWLAGDRSYTAIGALIAEFPSGTSGLYVAHRIQDHGQGGQTEATAIDLTADFSLHFGKTRLRMMGEAALVVGSTDYAQSVFTEGAHDILSHGGVARLGVVHGIFEGVLEGGWASGDDTPYDQTVRSFSFSSGYRVGVLMFNEVIRTSAAASALNIADPDLRDVAPRALDKVTHRGGVREAIYVNPRVALHPTKDLHVMAGFLYARSFGEYTDPFWSSLVGGVSAGPNGAVKQSDLGYELDVAVQYDFNLENLSLGLRGEFAYFVPGRVFDLPNGERAADVIGAGLQLEARL